MKLPRVRLALVALATVLSAASVAGATLATPTAVIKTDANEFQADSYDAGGLLAWSANTLAHPRAYNDYLSPDGGATKTKINAPGTKGYSPSFTDDGTEIYYQQVASGASDIKIYDVAGGTRSDPAGPVNTPRWEAWPSVSGDWILFNRNDVTRKNVPYQVVLVNMVTNETRVLASVTNKCRCVGAGELAGNHATWYRCGQTCNVYLYDILSGGSTSTKIPNPDVKVHYAPTVTADGTVYYVSSGFACGRNVRIVRYPLGGPATIIVALPSGVDSWYSGGADTSGGAGTNLYIDRVKCRSPYYADIYEIAGADTAGAVIVSAPGSGSGAGVHGPVDKPFAPSGAHA